MERDLPSPIQYIAYAIFLVAFWMLDVAFLIIKGRRWT